jgi:hypothetical protein
MDAGTRLSGTAKNGIARATAKDPYAHGGQRPARPASRITAFGDDRTASSTATTIAGAIHTQWCAQETGEISSPVSAQVRMPTIS